MSTQTIFDHWGKALFGLPALEPLRVQTEVELPPEALRIDLLLRPPQTLSATTRRILGAAERLVRAPCAMIELNSTVPSEITLSRSVRKYLKVSEGQLSTSSLTLICSERSEALLDTLKATPLDGGLSGFYEIPGLGTQRLVVIPDLPTFPETLLLRLLGRGPILRDALLEIQARPPHDPFHQVVALLDPFRRAFERRGALDPLSEEFDMSSIEFEAVREFFKQQKEEQRRLKKERRQYEQERLQHEQERLQHEQERLRLEALEQERLQMLVHLGARLLNRELTQDERAVLAARLPGEGGDAILTRWLAATPAEVEDWLRQMPAVEPPAAGEGEG